MESLYQLLLKNQTNLDRLRVRARYATDALLLTPPDFHRQYGPFADYWDEWYAETEIMLEEITSDITLTAQFVTELREFIAVAETKGVRTPNTQKKRYRHMTSIAREALSCQSDMLRLADERVAAHREFTERLYLVEAIDSIDE